MISHRTLMPRPTAPLVALLALVAGTALAAGGQAHTTRPFAGPKVNGGSVTHTTEAGTSVLTLSDDFVVPDTPAPHWRVVDSRGNAYLLDRLLTKGDVFHKRITVPSYVTDVSKVQIYCAWAEVVLGETSFDTPVR